MRARARFMGLALAVLAGLAAVSVDAAAVKQVSAGAYHLAVLYDDGTVSAWGSNEKGQLNVPSNLNNVVEIATGYEFTVALKRDGSLVAWGSNEWDQLKIPSSLPKIKQIAANGAHTLALSESGRVYAFGGNGYGQLNVPIGLSTATLVAAGDFFSVAVLSSGSVVAWGDSTYDVTTVPSRVSNLKQLSCAYHHCIGLTASGKIQTWGSNKYGESDIGENAFVNVKQVASGSWYSVVLLDDGRTFMFGGANDYNQADQAQFSGVGVDQIDGSSYNTIALLADGTVKVTGRSDMGQTSVPSRLLIPTKQISSSSSSSSSTTTPMSGKTTTSFSISTATATATAIPITNPSPKGEPDNGNGTPVAAIAGGVVGGIVAIAAIAGLLLWRRRKTKKEGAEAGVVAAPVIDKLAEGTPQAVIAEKAVYVPDNNHSAKPGSALPPYFSAASVGLAATAAAATAPPPRNEPTPAPAPAPAAPAPIIAQPSGSATPIRAFGTAISTFPATLPGHLALSQGDRVQVDKLYSDGWATGMNTSDASEGMFPAEVVVMDDGSKLTEFDATKATQVNAARPVPPGAKPAGY